jgi:predicted dehydrogenase
MTTRREFLQKSAAAGAWAAASPAIAASAQSPNDRIRVGLVGMGGRMKWHVMSLAKLAPQNVEIAAVGDCDQSRLGELEKRYPELAGKKLTLYDDQRKLFDDKSLDAVSFSTQDHWHALQTIWACQAGKDVYVEKPAAHNIFEGRKMVEAARKYGRIVQHGTQCRSSPNIVAGVQKLKEGAIGEVYMARAISYKLRGDLGKHNPRPVPPGLNWDAWVGPAKMVDYSSFMHRRWYWIANFASGDFANQLVHQVDIVRWALGLDTHPSKVQAMGGRFPPTTDEDTDLPNTMTYACQWSGRNVLTTFENRHWFTPGEAGLGDQYKFVQEQYPCGTIFFGTLGYMVFPDYSSYYTFLGPKREPGPSAAEPEHSLKGDEHFANWIAAIRSRKPQDLAADIEQGHLSTAVCHLAKIAWKLGRTVQFDAKTERFVGAAEADALLTRDYRPPYVVPAEV